MSQRPECGRCGMLRPFDFLVSDEEWRAIVGDDRAFWCFPCFDDAASQKSASYTVLRVTVPRTGRDPLVFTRGLFQES